MMHILRTKCSDWCIVHRILGCEVLYDEVAGTYSINQTKCVKDMSKKHLYLRVLLGSKPQRLM